MKAAKNLEKEGPSLVRHPLRALLASMRGGGGRLGLRRQGEKKRGKGDLRSTRRGAGERGLDPRDGIRGELGLHSPTPQDDHGKSASHNCLITG